MSKPKRKAAFEDAQLGLSFDPPAEPARADLAGLDRTVSAAIGRILRDDPATRFEVAARVSELLDDEVTKLMLDAYASEARDGHNISAARFFALIAATHRYDILDALCRRIGAKVLVGEEVYAAELGHVEAQLQTLEARRRSLKQLVKPIGPGGHRA